MNQQEDKTKIFKKWDVLLVDFSEDENTEAKKRPALTISPQEYNKNKKSIILVFITSNIDKKELYGDYEIQEWEEAGLVKPAKAQMNFCSVNKNRIKKLGELQEKDINNIEKKITDFFNF